MHLQSTCRSKLFIGSQAPNFARNGQLPGTTGRRVRDVDIDALNFLRLDDFCIATNDKVAALILETFFHRGTIVQIAEMTLLGSEHDGHIHERHFAINGGRLRVNVLISSNCRILGRVAHLPDDLIDIDKDMADLRETSCASFVGQQGLVRHDA